MYIDPVRDLGASLLKVEKPCRYIGGEIGRLANTEEHLQTLIAFPDLYEIGMSNQALRIIYNGLNRIPGVSCDRAFAPAPDFEQLLREKGLPLYGLDTGVSLKNLDLLLFTLGYELGLSGILAMLDISGIPLHADQREDDDPLVIAGGPAVSNPLPYSAFIDAFWIGEAEAGFFDLARELLAIKKNNTDRAQARAAMLDLIRKHPNMWVKGKENHSNVNNAVRAIDSHFAARNDEPAVYPVPGMKIVQHHGILEIMRGCPNGCRFCHAGYWYRPMRQKPPEMLVREAEAFISRGGYREMSLSSLSSGDYAGLGDLVDTLNEQFSGRHISFQLPSLRISTFALSLLEKISQTRRSGLTFAVETPQDFRQMALNKQVSKDSTVKILREAKQHGWRGAKFYFMIGLPMPGLDQENAGSEEDTIVQFIATVAKETSMHFNVNVGIFIPKPHTPYQWAAQINSEAAAAKLDYIRSRLKPMGHKVSVSDPLMSIMEGILSRGDERSGALVEQAYRAGSRLDPWKEFMARDTWQKILADNQELVNEFLGAKDLEIPLPWQSIKSGVSSAYLRKELEKSNKGEMTPPCTEYCPSPCGVCGKNESLPRTITNSVPAVRHEQKESIDSKSSYSLCGSWLDSSKNSKTDPAVWRLLFSFCKEGGAVFHGHLDLIEIFSMAMCRAGLDVIYTQGFNPLAKMEIVSPLSIGISACAEMAAIDFSHEIDPDDAMVKLNTSLPCGIRLNQAEIFCIKSGAKKHSLSSLLWGFAYEEPDSQTAYIPAMGEKAYREQRLSAGETLFSLCRTQVLAKNTSISDNNPSVQPYSSYFKVYQSLYL